MLAEPDRDAASRVAATVAATVGVVVDETPRRDRSLDAPRTRVVGAHRINACDRRSNADHVTDGQFGKTQRADSGLVQR